MTSTDVVCVDYVGQTWSGKLFDHSYGTAAPPKVFALDQVIDGWREGLAGTHVGDRVEIVVPPVKGYGDQAQKDSAGKVTIPAESTLVFVVDVHGRLDPTDTSALKAAHPIADADIPDGITVSGELGAQPTVSVAPSVAPSTEQRLIVLAEGTGEPIEADDYVAAHVTIHTFESGQTQSTWQSGKMQVTAGPVGQSTLYGGIRVGTRALVLSPPGTSSQGEKVPAAVYVIDYGAKMTATRAGK